MIYGELTLDWDYYMIKMLKQHKSKVLKLIKSTTTKIQVLDTKKGLNLIAELKEPADLNQLLLLRLYCFDDIFRIRNEISKSFDNQAHRINRIWLTKDGYTKTTIFSEETKKFNIAEFDKFLVMIENKRPIKEEAKK